MKKLISVLLLIMLLSACSSPEGVRSDAHKSAKDAFLLIDASFNEDKFISEYDSKRITAFIDRYTNLKDQSITEKEYELAKDIKKLFENETHYQAMRTLKRFDLVEQDIEDHKNMKIELMSKYNIK